MEFGDDWDDFDEKKEAEASSPARFLTTPRIIFGVVIVAVLAIVIGRLVVHEKPDLSEIPHQLLGLWTCDEADRSDQYVDFRRTFVTFGSGGPRANKCRVIGSTSEKVGDLDQHTIFYRDQAGTRHIRDVLVDSGQGSMRFTDEPRITYSKYGD